MSLGLWHLGHDAAALERAAGSWSDAASTLVAAGDGVGTASRSVLGVGWDGASAEGYDAHRRLLVADADAAAALADQAAALLLATAGSVRAAQSGLDGSWAALSGIERSGTGSDLVLRPADGAERAVVEQQREVATSIRRHLDGTLAADAVRLADLTVQWAELSARWEAAAAGAPSFPGPPDRGGTGILVVDGVAMVGTGWGDSCLSVTTDPDTGEVLVDVDGTTHRLPPGTRVEVVAGSGDDGVVVGAGVPGVTVLGGQGVDTVRGGHGADVIVGGYGDDVITGGGQGDTVFGGAGQDYLDGQGGGDLVDGGAGNDTVYGLGGRDTLTGGEGDDYLEGGAGADQLAAGAGADVVSAGTGDDTASGGAGADVVYAGDGDDDVVGGSGHDTAHTQPVADLSALDEHLDIQGPPEFVERVRADLEMLAASPRGQELLQGIASGLGADGEATIVIRPSTGADPDVAFLDPSGEEGADYVLGYEPTFDDLRGHTPPVVGLGHELAHLWDQVNGHADDLGGETEGVDNGELAATGLPIDHDDDPGTPAVVDPEHPLAITENGLRDELGLPDREDYQR